MRRGLAWIFAAVVFGLAAWGVRAGETIYHSAAGFSMEAPEGWVQARDEDVVQAGRWLFDVVGGGVGGGYAGGAAARWDAGFQERREGDGGLNYPYVLVQVTKLQSVPPSVAEMRMIAGSLSPSVKRELGAESQRHVTKLETYEESFDEEKLTYEAPLKMTVAGVGEVRGLLVGHFGRGVLVQVCYFDRAENYSEGLVTRARMNNSFRFDEEAAHPRHRGLGWRIKAVVGGFVALMVLGKVIVGRASHRYMRRPKA
jgi:hypothetical protein